jgi:hypothetical protein
MSLASAHLQTRLTKSHVQRSGHRHSDDAFRVSDGCVPDSLPDPLPTNIEMASTYGTRQLISKAKVVHEVSKLSTPLDKYRCTSLVLARV